MSKAWTSQSISWHIKRNNHWNFGLPSVGFCATVDTLTKTWFGARAGKGTAFCTSAGDPRLGTSTTKAFVVVWLILVVAEDINNMEDNAKVKMENNNSRCDG